MVYSYGRTPSQMPWTLAWREVGNKAFKRPEGQALAAQAQGIWWGMVCMVPHDLVPQCLAQEGPGVEGTAEQNSRARLDNLTHLSPLCSSLLDKTGEELLTCFSTAAPLSSLRSTTGVSSVHAHVVRSCGADREVHPESPRACWGPGLTPLTCHTQHIPLPWPLPPNPPLPAPPASSLLLPLLSSCPPQLHTLWLLPPSPPPLNSSKFLPGYTQTAAATATAPLPTDTGSVSCPREEPCPRAKP